jgi:GntR family transcriptional regulator
VPDPKYRLIAGYLQRRIESGEWPPGARLPPEPKLQDEYGASRNTVRDAVNWLKARGLVSTQQGRGTFVNEPIKPFGITLSVNPQTGFGGGEGESYEDEVKAQKRVPGTSTPTVGVEEADVKVASALRISIGDMVVNRHQERFINKKPWSLQTTFYPMTFVTQGAGDLLKPQDMRPGVVAYLKEKLDIEQRYYQDAIEVRQPREKEAAFLELPDDANVAVSVHYRIAYDMRSRPFRLTVSIFPADRHQFAMFFGDVPDDVARSGSAWFPGEQVAVKRTETGEG